MGFIKHGEGRIERVETTPGQKDAAVHQQAEWTDNDTQELVEENTEADSE